MQQGRGSETKVTWEEQQDINKFSKLNNRFHELEDEIQIDKGAVALAASEVAFMLQAGQHPNLQTTIEPGPSMIARQEPVQS